MTAWAEAMELQRAALNAVWRDLMLNAKTEHDCGIGDCQKPLCRRLYALEYALGWYDEEEP